MNKGRRHRCSKHNDQMIYYGEECLKCRIDKLLEYAVRLKKHIAELEDGKGEPKRTWVVTRLHDHIAYELAKALGGRLDVFWTDKGEDIDEPHYNCYEEHKDDMFWLYDGLLFSTCSERDRVNMLPEHGAKYSNTYGSNFRHDTSLIEFQYKESAERFIELYRIVTLHTMQVRKDELSDGRREGVKSVLDTISEMSSEQFDNLEVESFEKMRRRDAKR